MTNFDEMSDLLTISEVAGLLRVSNQTLKRWHSIGKLVPIIINKRGDRRYYKVRLKIFLGIE